MEDLDLKLLRNYYYYYYITAGKSQSPGAKSGKRDGLQKKTS